jgi:hypothetical protein
MIANSQREERERQITNYHIVIAQLKCQQIENKMGKVANAITTTAMRIE